VRDVGRAGRRLATLISLANGGTFSALVAVAPALLQKTPPADAIKNRFLTFAVGQSISLDTVTIRLNAFGYLRQDQVNLPGTFARRGDILDIFPADADNPIRIDLFGDDIETIRLFDVESQRSEGKIDSITVTAAHEVVFTRESIAKAVAHLRKLAEKRVAEMEKAKEETTRIDRLRESAEGDIARLGQAAYFGGIERYLPLLHPNAVTAFNYLPEDLLVVIDEPAQMKSHAERDIDGVLKNLAGRAERGEILPVEGTLCLEFEEGIRQVTDHRPTLYFELLARSLSFVRPETSLVAQAGNAETFAGRPGPFLDALTTYARNNVRVVVVSAQAPRVRGMLGSKEISEVSLSHLMRTSQDAGLGTGGVALVNGLLPSGFKITDARLVILTEPRFLGRLPISSKSTSTRISGWHADYLSS